MLRWEKKVLRLEKNHGWKARPGHNILVLDRGAVRFDYPADWVVRPGDGPIELRDREPPDDNCLLQVSLIHLPDIGRGWDSLPVEALLRDILDSEEREVTARRETVEVRRDDLELAWAEILFTDPEERREACSRICLARASNLQAVITMEFWPQDGERFTPVWDEVLRSLQIGIRVDDPTRRRVH